MAKVTTPNNDLSFFHSLGFSITLSIEDGVRNVVKGYKRNTKRVESADQFIQLIYDSKRDDWNNLTAPQKEVWNDKGEEYGMTGFQLFMSEGFKENFNARYKEGRYKGCYYGAMIP